MHGAGVYSYHSLECCFLYTLKIYYNISFPDLQHAASATCPPLLGVTDTDIIYTQEPVVSGNFSVDTRALYECTSGELFEGDTIRTCLADGSWSGVEPICLREWNCSE